MASEIVQSFNPKEVYFLGAGTSAVIGVPTFSDFRKKATEIYGLSSDEPKRELFKRVLKHWREGFNEFNIEQYYAAVEMREMLAADNSFDRENPKNITTDDIEKFICSTIQESLKNIDTDEGHDKDESYYNFLSRIGISRAAIITTNWDIVLETSKFSLNSNWINYEGVKSYEIGSINRDAQFHILKLHGSLNWGFCEDCGNIYYFNKKRYDDITLGDVECDKCKPKHVKLKTVIVPPTLSKLAKAQPQLVHIWNTAQVYLKSCEKIYFIGYSFPETDVQMKIFILNALRENSKLNEVIIVSNQKHGQSKIDFEERCLSILPAHFSQSKMKFDYDGFEKFYEKLPEYHTSKNGVISSEWIHE
ncbi:MAG: SIR2 family protein [Candidatus Methanoperedens sp.]|nr:SIR2 family protein [Candidatus Methanoperedens sp.]MCZ7406443.1 SIR2 family protein [Candidatus Methanoperedens sp.]